MFHQRIHFDSVIPQKNLKEILTLKTDKITCLNTAHVISNWRAFNFADIKYCVKNVNLNFLIKN